MNQQDRRGTERATSTRPIDVAPGDTATISRRAMAAAPAARQRQLSLETRLTREYGVPFPFVGAGMGFVWMPNRVAAVSNGGGIGVLGNVIEPPLGTRALIQATKALTPNLFGVDFLFDESAFASVTSGPK